MKKLVSIILCLCMLISVFCLFTVGVDACSALCLGRLAKLTKKGGKMLLDRIGISEDLGIYRHKAVAGSALAVRVGVV